MKREVIIALDFPNREMTAEFLDKFIDVKPFVKVGMELFYAEGPAIVEEIKRRGHKIFLDLKLHDIPNTVEKAMISIAKLDVDIVNVHAAGTIKMMKAAKKGLLKGSSLYDVGRVPLTIAVTQLTSTDQEHMESEILIKEDINDVIKRYAANAKEAGLDGVVCSPLEASMIHETLGDEFITVTPGVRFKDLSKGDQKRVTTPAMAKELGSDYIVVGRPITQAEDPREAYERCVKEFVK